MFDSAILRMLMQVIVTYFFIAMYYVSNKLIFLMGPDPGLRKKIKRFVHSKVALFNLSALH